LTDARSSNRSRFFLDARQGPFEKLERIPVPWIFKILAKHYDDRAVELTEHELKNFQVGFANLWKCAAKIAEIVEHDQGARFQLSSRELGRAVGVSQSTASRCLRKLRALGIVALWRLHYSSFIAMVGWVGVASIYQVLTRPYGSRSSSGFCSPERAKHHPGPAKTSGRTSSLTS
jgi:hypothetical protein